MDTKKYAQLTQLHYLIDKYPDQERAEKKINKKLIKRGFNDYKVETVNRGVLHYKNTKDNSNVISIKGTDKYNPRDLISDVKLGLGIQSSDKQFKERRKQVKEIYRNHSGDKYITGHSLGSSIATDMLSKSKSLLDNTKKAMLYNTGYTSAFHNSIKPDKETKKQMRDKIIHNHTKGDIISTTLTDKRHGTLKTIKVNSSNPLELHSLKPYTNESETEIMGGE